MKRMHIALVTAALGLGLSASAGAQSNTTLTGKLVDIATYMTKDHNMDAMHGMKGEAAKGDAMKGDAMKGDAMKGDAMKGDAMKGDAMKGDHAAADCPALGLVTSSGKVFFVASQMGTPMGASLCKKVNSNVTLSGAGYSQAGASLRLVSALK